MTEVKVTEKAQEEEEWTPEEQAAFFHKQALLRLYASLVLDKENV